MGQADDDEAEQLAPRVVHNHYEQSRNGNGNGVLMKILVAVCGFTLVMLAGMQGFMWRSQIDFQSDMIRRMTRVETQLEERVND